MRPGGISHHIQLEFLYTMNTALRTPIIPGARVGEGNTGQAKSGKICTVGCKLPNGFTMELGLFGTEEYKSFKLHGINSAKIIGGYGITENVPEEFFDRWLEKMKDFKMIRRGLIFKQAGKLDEASVVALGREMAKEKTGLEPKDRKDLPKGLEVMSR
jgi:hypothetical protein